MTNGDEQAKGPGDKRRYTRYKVKKPVRVRVDDEVIDGETVDVSLGGIALTALVDMTTEQFVKLHLGKFDELTGQVVRGFDDGFAVEFDTVEEGGSVLERDLKAMPPESAEQETPDEPGDERGRMEARLKAMFGGDE